MSSLTQTTPQNPEPQPKTEVRGPFAALRRVFPAGEVIRFLAVGGFNTLFAYSLFLAAVHMFHTWMPTRPLALIVDLAQIVAKPVSITVAFLGYKHFVFRTRGNYLKEWLKCVVVYGVSTPFELVILPLATTFFTWFALTQGKAPALAGIVNSVCIASYSYFAHKKFSFKR